MPKDFKVKSRTSSFTWLSKRDLYDYFKEKYTLTQERIDEEIADVMKIFRLRKGQTINTQELWQKVGNMIEQKIADDTKEL